MTPEHPADTRTFSGQENPLLAAAAPLLNAIVQIRLAATHDDPAGLRQQLVDEIRQFEARSKNIGLPFDMIIGARYCLCSVLDEAAAQTPWGTRGVWSGNGLLVTFHNESWGGEKVFQLLSRISQTPAQHLWLLEVIHYCLLLGYEGRYRAVEQGRLQRDAVRNRLAQLINDTRGELPPQPEPQPLEPVGRDSRWRPPVPLWACIALTAFIASMIYSGLNWRLGNAAEPLLRAIWETPLPQNEIARNSSSQALLDLRQRLDDLITARQLDVADGTNGSKVIIAADKLFSPSGSDLTPEGRAIITRVSAAMDNIKGTILISVYTDNRPVHSTHFASNYEYSLAQARSISAQMRQQMLEPEHLLRSEGRGDSSPLLPNDSDENRAQNRRVEIVLFPAPEVKTSQARKS
ncbi:type IVB secretion system protein IcmH/DotU [Pantoea sp. CCBC3-3-1]|uniref:type IVB secretion system protein IcmH/DotU n=1 Tax=Pantoea sp. CCBC3-3-1 TaxID=2490851 RepID=UPI0011BF60DB|nr:type IVB secretion system protein IcmH/DotU [Pantoea sp. CCBC3-3-1]